MNTRRAKTLKIRGLVLLTLLLAAGLTPGTAWAFLTGDAPVAVEAGPPPVYSDPLGRAIGGYDPVAYFTEGEALYGRGTITYEWNGARWQFVSERNRAAFAADPGRYAPRYGGYCAYAVSRGYAVSPDPTYWTIVDGRLYLNRRHVWHEWQARRAELITRADRVWAGHRTAAR